MQTGSINYYHPCCGETCYWQKQSMERHTVDRNKVQLWRDTLLRETKYKQNAAGRFTTKAEVLPWHRPSWACWGDVGRGWAWIGTPSASAHSPADSPWSRCGGGSPQQCQCFWPASGWSERPVCIVQCYCKQLKSPVWERNVCIHCTVKVNPPLSDLINSLGPRPATALSLQNPMQREVTVSNVIWKETQ